MRVLFFIFSDSISNKKKENGLDGGTENATSVVPRTLAEIKKKWDDVKIITKKRAVEVERVS